MLKRHILRLFHKMGTLLLDTFASGVSNGLFSNPLVFPTPPVTQVQFDDRRQRFSVAASDYNIFGATKKTTFLQEQKLMIDTLDLVADYVETIANGDASLMILAGFQPSVSEAQKNTPLVKIANFSLGRTDVTGEVVVEIPAIADRGTVNYACICSEGAPIINPVVVNGQLKTDATDVTVRTDINKSRRKIFTGLTPGVIYHFYVFASNTVSVSPLSDPKTIMAA